MPLPLLRATCLAMLAAVLTSPCLAAGTPCEAEKATLAAIEAGLQRRPADATLHYFHAAAWARCNDLPASLAALRQVLAHGDGFLPVRDAGFAPLWDSAEFRALRDEFAARLPKVGSKARVAFQLQDPGLIPEGIAFDAKAQALYIGSIAHAQIRRVVRGGDEQVFADADDGLEQVLGLAIDAQRRRLYAVSTSQLLPPEQPVDNAILVFDLDSAERIARLEADDAGQLNDVAVAVDGTIYASDSRNGGLFRALPGEAQLQRWVDPNQLPNPNGLAVAGDWLYVAHATGIARIKRADASLLPRLDNATREQLSAIDGLYLQGNALIAVQNWTHPGRLMRFELNADGDAVTAAQTLLSHHHPALDEPTTAAVAGDRVLLLANSQVGRLQPDGSLRNAESLRAPQVLALPLPAASESTDPPLHNEPANTEVNR